MPEGTSDTEPTEGETVGAVVSDGAYTLFAADFNDTETALEAYAALEKIEDGGSLEIEGVIVVKRNDDGTLDVQKTTDHSTKSGMRWGILGGIALGVFFPPSIIGSAVVLGAGGAAAGKVRERHHRRQLADELATAIAPGHSGILALVTDPNAVEIQRALAKADRIVKSAIDDAAARDLKAAAKEAESA